MNYIREIKAFYDQLEINPLSTSSIALWHALMHICNKTGWINEFTVAVSVLCLKTGLKERAIYDARNELKIKGYISYKARGGNRSSIYTITRLSAIDADKSVDKPADKSVDKPADKSVALIKLNETNLIDDVEADAQVEIAATLETEFGRLASPAEIEKLFYYVDQGMDKQVVCEAINRSRLNSVLKVSYAEGILKAWLSEGIKDLAGVASSDLKREKAKTKPGAKGKGGNKLPSVEPGKYKDIYMG